MKQLVFLTFFSAVYANAYSIESSLQALEYLDKMGKALRTLNYFGTVIYIHDGNIESMKIFHRMGDEGEIERVVHLSGEAREVIRKNDVVTCYLPDSESVLVEKRRFSSGLIPKPFANFEEFASIYTFSVQKQDRIAGKTARIILINPKDKYRYGYRLWIDESNGLLLKSEMLNTQGEILEQLMFASVEVVDTIPEDLLKPEIASEQYTWFKNDPQPINMAQSQSDFKWKINRLPSGFVLRDYYQKQMLNEVTPTDHMVITDGLATVSVYIEPFSAESHSFVGASKVGAMNIFGSIVDDFHVTVVGEVPDTTVQMIAQSVKKTGMINNDSVVSK